MDVKSKKGEGSDFYFLLEFGVGSQDEKEGFQSHLKLCPRLYCIGETMVQNWKTCC